jgi:biopolymer transport protein ExbD
MAFRRKHNEESEVFTDSLNDILFILMMFFLIVATIGNPNIVKVNTPRDAKDTKAKQALTVSIDKNQNFSLGTKRVDPGMLDTLLSLEIAKYRKGPLDTPTVTVNADTVAYYGEVYKIIRIAKRNKARVVATVH